MELSKYDDKLYVRKHFHTGPIEKYLLSCPLSKVECSEYENCSTDHL